MKNNDSKPLLVEIVEDSATQATILKRYLATEGYKVIAASNGREGFEMAYEQRPDLICSDISMPEMNGFEMCRALKEDDSLKSIPVILLSQLSDPSDILKALEVKVDCYITKPYDKDFLLSKIRLLTGKHLQFKNNTNERYTEVSYSGNSYRIRAGRGQTTSVLLSVYENAVMQNSELLETREKLQLLNNELQLKCSELEKSEERIRQYSKKLEESNKDLESFSYSVSHDLRAPLRAIDGFSHILLDGYLDKIGDEGKHYLSTISESAEKMGELIDAILTFSRTGRKELDLSQVDMESLASEVLEELKEVMEGRKINIDMGKLPPCRGDRTMMHQVVFNLLSNAIKFTSKLEVSSIEISAGVEETENVYCIRDNGAGFDMEHSEKLFAIFQRLHRGDEFEGTGAGLAIVKQILEKQGGRIWAEGKVNEGAVFWFSLPKAE